MDHTLSKLFIWYFCIEKKIDGGIIIIIIIIIIH